MVKELFECVWPFCGISFLHYYYLQKKSWKNFLVNIALPKYELSVSIDNFIDTLSSNLLREMFPPTRISKTSTLIDNISNLTSLEQIVSDHLFIFKRFFLNFT